MLWYRGLYLLIETYATTRVKSGEYSVGLTKCLGTMPLIHVNAVNVSYSQWHHTGTT